MKLEIFDKHDQMVCRLEDNEAMFGSFPVDDDMRLHVSMLCQLSLVLELS